MSHGIFATLFYIPLYNALISLITLFPWKSAGLAVVLLTLIIRLILFPLSRATIKTQLNMKRIEPEIEAIKKKYTDKQEQARQTMQLYKEKGINPFAGLFLVLIQFPILIALYQVFRSGLPKVDPTLLYSFVHMPSIIGMSFIGINLAERSIILALIAVITQFIQLNISLPAKKKKAAAAKDSKPNAPSFKNDFADSLNMQMKYIFPLVMFPIALFSAVLGLYLTTSNIFMILQELFVRRKLEKQYGIIRK